MTLDAKYASKSVYLIAFKLDDSRGSGHISRGARLSCLDVNLMGIPSMKNIGNAAVVVSWYQIRRRLRRELFLIKSYLQHIFATPFHIFAGAWSLESEIWQLHKPDGRTVIGLLIGDTHVDVFFSQSVSKSGVRNSFTVSSFFGIVLTTFLERVYLCLSRLFTCATTWRMSARLFVVSVISLLFLLSNHLLAYLSKQYLIFCGLR